MDLDEFIHQHKDYDIFTKWRFHKWRLSINWINLKYTLCTISYITEPFFDPHVKQIDSTNIKRLFFRVFQKFHGLNTFDWSLQRTESLEMSVVYPTFSVRHFCTRWITPTLLTKCYILIHGSLESVFSTPWWRSLVLTRN